MRSEVISAERRTDGWYEAESLWLLSDAEVAQFQRAGLEKESTDRNRLTQVHHVLSPARAATRGQRIIRREKDGWLLHASGVYLPPDIEPDDPRLWRYADASPTNPAWTRLAVSRGDTAVIEAFSFVPTKYLSEKDGPPEYLDPQWQRETFIRDPDSEVEGIVDWKGGLLDSQLTRGKPIRSRQRTTLNLQVGASADDADQRAGSVDTTAALAQSDSLTEWVGFRWETAGLAGVAVNSALVSFVLSSALDEPLMVFYCEDADAPAQFTTATDNISSRSQTSASMLWDSTDVGADGATFDAAPEITTAVQEVVDRAGFDEAIVIFGVQSSSNSGRDFGAFTYDFDTALAAKLDVDFAGSEPEPVEVTPAAASLTLTGAAPTVTATAHQTVTPGNASLAITAHAPTVTATANVVVTPSAAELTITGAAPTVSLSDNVTVVPAAAELTLTGAAPAVTTTANVLVTPDAVELTITSAAPTVSTTAHVTVEPAAASLTVTGAAPTVSTTANVTVTPDAASLTATGATPSVQTTAHVTVTPSAVSLTLTGHAPTVSTSDEQVLEPAAVSLMLTGHAPSVTATDHQSVTPTAASLTLTGAVPTVTATDHQTVTPDAVSLSITTAAPSVTTSAHQVVEPAAASLELTGAAPSVVLSGNQLVTPAAAMLALTGNVPVVTASGHIVAIPGAVALTLTTHVPTVAEVTITSGVGRPVPAGRASVRNGGFTVPERPARSKTWDTG